MTRPQVTDKVESRLTITGLGKKKLTISTWQLCELKQYRRHWNYVNAKWKKCVKEENYPMTCSERCQTCLLTGIRSVKWQEGRRRTEVNTVVSSIVELIWSIKQAAGASGSGQTQSSSAWRHMFSVWVHNFSLARKWFNWAQRVYECEHPPASFISS